MGNVLINEDYMRSAADAIRIKKSSTAGILAENFAQEILSIPTGGSATLIEKTITENGEYVASDDGVDGYSKVIVDTSSPVKPNPFDDAELIQLAGQGGGTLSQSYKNFDFIQITISPGGMRGQSFIATRDFITTLQELYASYGNNGGRTEFNSNSFNWGNSTYVTTYVQSETSIQRSSSSAGFAIDVIHGININGLVTVTDLFKTSNTRFNQSNAKLGDKIVLSDDIYNYDLISTFVNIEGGSNFYSFRTYTPADFINTNPPIYQDSSIYGLQVLGPYSSYLEGHREYPFGGVPGVWAYENNTLTCVQAAGKSGFGIQWIQGIKINKG